MNVPHDNSKRRFLKTTAYVVPVIMTLKAVPALATNGSNCNNGVGNGPDCDPPGFVKNDLINQNNDDFGGIPGDPQNQGGIN